MSPYTNERDTSSFGGLLRRLRAAAGLSQEELALRAGLSVPGVGALERGERRRPHLHTVTALADALGISEEERAALVGARERGPDAPAKSPAFRPPPAPPTPLVGREQELAEVMGLLARTRLLTLVGAGGVGKTRLALEISARIAAGAGEVPGEAGSRFADGVAFVSLAALADPSLVLSTTARALGLKEAAGGLSPRDALRAELRSKKVLLVLDNFEHVVEASTEVSDLLADCPHLSVLATSREALRLRGEQRFPVPPLPVPDLAGVPPPEEVARADAARLFVERAREIEPGFELTRANAAAVAAICRRLDGLPLALELAAAQVRLLSPRAILARLDEALPLPASGAARDLPERQQTMRRTVAWSHDLLRDEEQTAFRRLSVFAGSFPLEAAEAVCSTNSLPEGDSVVEVLYSLLDKSLVISAEASGDEPRFGMLETIRDYGRERLAHSGEEDEVRTRHARFYLELAEAAYPKLKVLDGEHSQRVVWQARLEGELDDLRAAMRWFEEAGAPEMALRLGGALSWFWYFGGYWSEGRARLEGARAAESASPTVRARALLGAGQIAFSQGDHAAGLMLEESAALFREAGDLAGLGYVLPTLSQEMMGRKDTARARALSAEGVKIARETGNRFTLGACLATSGMVALMSGDGPAVARPYLEESIEVARKIEDGWLLSVPLRVLSLVALQQGCREEAEALVKESLVLMRKTGERYFVSNSLELLAQLCGAWGEHARAARLYEASEALREITGAGVISVLRPSHDRGVAATRAALGEEDFAAKWAEGQAMTSDEAIDYALEEAAPEATP